MSFLRQFLSNSSSHSTSMSQQILLLLAVSFFSFSLSAQVVNEAFIQPVSARQSSFGFTNGEASNAIDGNTNGNWMFSPANSITHTRIENSPWLEVDLGAEYEISKIELWNRTDACCASRLTNMNVLVKSCEDDQGTPVLTENYQYSASDDVPLVLPAAQRGRYVRVQLYGSNTTLHLAEVKVFGSSYNIDKPECACLESATDTDFCSLTATTGVSDGFIELNWDFTAPEIVSPGAPIFCRLLRIDAEGEETTIMSSSHDSPAPEERLVGTFRDRVAAAKTYDYRLEVRNEEFGILGKQFTATGSTAVFQAPSDFTATDGTALDRVNLAWQHHTDLPISYRILRIDANLDTVQLDTVSRESDEDLSLTYRDIYREGSNNGLRSGQTYNYCIEPYYAPTVTTYPAICDDGSVTDLAFAASDDAHPDRVRLSWNSLSEVAEELTIYEND
ncbi:MAG: discoidin domain-containing protein, partial [Bacteroidota bacterium]